MNDHVGSGNALVVGATGLIGSAIVRRLLDTGWSVTATARSPKAADWAADALDGARVEIVPDLLEPGAVDALFEPTPPDVLVSTAGLMSARGVDAAKAIVDGNLTTTTVLLDACVRGDVGRAIVFGSGFEYRSVF